MRKIIGSFTLVVFVVLSTVWLIGCGDNPKDNPLGTDGNSVSVDSASASWTLVNSSKTSGVWVYTFLAKGFFYPAAKNAIMVGLKDKNDWSVGDLGDSVRVNDWEFTVALENGDKVVNFRDRDNKDNWAKLPCLRNTGYFQSSPLGGNLAFNVKDGIMSKIGGGSPSGTRDTLIIIQRIINGVTVYDTLFKNDTTKITDTVWLTLGDILKTQGDPIDMGNGYWRNTFLFSTKIVVVRDTSYRPFGIGLPSWDTIRPLAKAANGYYSLVVTYQVGRHKLGVGGDYKRAWADSATLANSYWGKLTPDGEIIEVVVNKTGHVLPGSLVDTSTAPSTRDTVFIRDTTVKVLRDTVKIPGKTIVDTLIIIKINNILDTIVLRDTVVNTKIVRDTVIKVIRDTVKIPGKTIVDTLIIIRINTVYDTTRIRDTVVNTVIVVKRDTITIKGAVIHDTLRINTVTHDTVHTRDTVYLATTVIDKGTVVDSTKTFLRDTAWVDADSLKGVITEDTIVSSRSIHKYLIVSAKGDTTPKADTSAVSNKIFQYRTDTVSFVISQYGGATLVGADTVYRFGVTAKAFTYSGKGDDSVSLTGISDTSKWRFAGKIGGYFVFDVKLIGGLTYSLNFVGNKGTWAKQEILMLSPFAVKSGSNCDIVVKGGGIMGLVKP